MTMCVWWEQVSAATDGELDEPARSAALAHAHGCATCTTMILSTELKSGSDRRRFVIDPAELTPHERRWLEARWTRPLLIVAAVAIVALAVPAYVGADGLSAESHAARHLASWQIGFGVGLFVAAWMSRLSHAMLAFAATFAALILTAAAIEVIGGHRGPRSGPVHLVELIGVLLLWRLTPPHFLPWKRHGRASATADQRQASPQPQLRLIASPDDPNDPR